jgi:hypothetical protein
MFVSFAFIFIIFLLYGFFRAVYEAETSTGPAADASALTPAQGGAVLSGAGEVAREFGRVHAGVEIGQIPFGQRPEIGGRLGGSRGGGRRLRGGGKARGHWAGIQRGSGQISALTPLRSSRRAPLEMAGRGRPVNSDFTVLREHRAETKQSGRERSIHVEHDSCR